jgi:hypothetical protein
MRIVRAIILVGVLVVSFWVTLQVLDYVRERSARLELTPAPTSDERTAIFFRVSEPVQRNGKDVSLVTSIGRRIPVKEGAPQGVVGSLTIVAAETSSPLTKLDGWAVDQRARRAHCQVVATILDRIWVSGFSDKPRPDIAALGQEYLLSGFSIEGRRPAKADLSSIRMYVLLNDATAEELDYGPGVLHGAAAR